MRDPIAARARGLIFLKNNPMQSRRVVSKYRDCMNWDCDPGGAGSGKANFVSAAVDLGEPPLHVESGLQAVAAIARIR
jgi:hypothetical protein